MDTINFYSTRGEYGCFSNFSRHEVLYDRMLWKTSEHAYQQAKFLDHVNKTNIYEAKTPREAADIGRDKSRPLRVDWEQVKDQVMFDVVYSKFKYNEDIQKILLSTGDSLLVEHTKNDSYWGDGGDGSGKNMLGKTLMFVRNKLNEDN